MTEEVKIAEPVVGRGSAALLLARVRLRAQLRVLWMRSEWAASLEQPLAGLAITHAEVDRLLRDPAESAAEEALFYRTNPAAGRLSEQIEAVEAEFAQDPAWSRLRREFALSPFETDLLALAVAAEIDPPLRRVYAYLHDDAAAGHATPWLASTLFHGEGPALLDPQSPLVQWRLAHTTEAGAGAWAAHAPWTADPYIVFWLLGRPTNDPALEFAAEFVPQTRTADTACLYPELLASMADLLQSAQGRAVEIELVAAQGAGKRTLAAQFAATLGCGLIAVEADQLLPHDLPPPAAAERIVHAVRIARLVGAILYWNGGERTSLRVWQATGGYSGVMLFGVPSASVSEAQSPAARRSFTLPPLRREARIALWAEFSGEPVPRAVADGNFKPADIVKAAQLAPAGKGAVMELCQDNARTPNALFTPLPCPYTWDDIVLHNSVREHLRELEEQVRLRPAVYEEWGFERLCPMGRGITALFAGNSGTGKTMAAQVLARSLELKLLRVDLAGVVNKYIGETEKRLKEVFDACERSSVLLFFDEADALFGQRTQVKDAHDRFANIEIDYLLQRMEQFEGVAILATNRKGDLDKAFLRRIRFIVDFLPPGPAERMALWRHALDSRPAGCEEILGGIDWDFLAHKLTMTGADITMAALNAAFLARSQGSRITMDHILHTSRREMTKHGVVVRPGEWG